MKPLYQPQGIHQLPGTYQQSYNTFQYPKNLQIKSPNFASQMPTGFSSIPNSTNNEQQTKKILTTIKSIDEKKDSLTPTGSKKLMKYEKPAFLIAKQHHYSDPPNTQDTQSLRKQQSQPDLRITCPNVLKKIEQSNLKQQPPTSLRYTTHGAAKYGSVITEAKKYQDQQQQKIMKKNSGGNQHISHKFESPYKSMTETKKLSEKASFKTLNQIWSNKEKNSQKTKRNIINGFEIFKQLGKGKFGQVCLARHIQTGFIVALKKIIKAKVMQYQMVEQFKRQIKLHSALDHPNIVKFYGFFQDTDHIYLILQYISGGTLFDYLAEKDVLSPKQAAQFLKDTIEALCYMHERSIAHRDIKPENIVLTAEKVAKLCDFGWSALVQSSRTTYCGTFDYAPPEILERKNYDTAVDMWCIGVLAFQLLTGRVPFEGEKRKQIMQKIISVDKTKIRYPSQVPEDAKHFINQLVQKDPTLRPKCKQLLKHPFIVNNTKKNQVLAFPKQKKV